MKEKIFHKLSKEKQNDIRREYKEKWSVEYNYSIRLYIIYVILGVFTIIGLSIALFIDFMVGSLIFTMALILMIIVIYFLYRSNYNFYRFLKRKGYKYDEKKR